MGNNDNPEHRESESGGIDEKYKELERLLKELPPAPPDKETFEEYLDGKSEEE